jgi:hypothetical protein
MSRYRFGPDPCARADIDHPPRSFDTIVDMEVRGDVPTPDLDALGSPVPNLVELTRKLDFVIAHITHNIPVSLLFALCLPDGLRSPPSPSPGRSRDSANHVLPNTWEIWTHQGDATA